MWIYYGYTLQLLRSTSLFCFFLVSETATLIVVKLTNYDIIMYPALFWYDTNHYICMLGHLLESTYHHLSNLVRPPGGHCLNTYRLWVGSPRFICGSGARRFHLRMSGPQMNSEVPPIVKIPQWSSQWCLRQDAPRHQEFSFRFLSLHVHALPLRVAPCQESDMNLVEVSKRT